MTTMTTKSEPRSAFFYGTLMAPQVLHRVCHGGMQADNAIYRNHNLKFHPAILHDYRRHKVEDADYPAITGTPGSTVRGTYVTGLTKVDIYRLDIFEGDQYHRKVVKVKLLTEVGDENGNGNVEGDEVEAETFVWSDAPRGLEKEEWDFGEFQREKMRFWVGREGEGEYEDVDRAVEAMEQDGTGGRGVNGSIGKALEEVHKNAV